MVEWFTENSTVPLVMGTILVIVFLAFWITSRERVMAIVALIVMMLTIGTVACENFVVTPREEVENIVYQLATHAQRNDWAGALNYISEGEVDTFNKAKQETSRYECSSCRVLGTKYFTLHSDIRAEVCFVVAVQVHLKDYPGDNFFHREVTLHFKKNQDDEWRIYEYSHQHPQSGLSP